MARGHFAVDDPYTSYLRALTDAELEGTVRDHIWMAEFGPLRARWNWVERRDQCVAECRRRGRADIESRARDACARVVIESEYEVT